MKSFFPLICVTFLIFGCQTEPKGDATRFRQGVFEIPAGKGYSKTIITRNDSIQIEEYTKFVDVTVDGKVEQKEIKRIDTLYINWKNNFFYTLKMKSPRKAIDRDIFYVQITKVTDTSYNFSNKIGFSKYKQSGIVYKIK